jgi:hypothetical protein
MKKLCLAAAFGLVASFAAVDARAMPLAPLAAPEASDITLVAQGCGRGYERNRFGECRPMRGWRGDRGPRVVIPTMRGPRERCRIVIDHRGRREVCVRR